MTEETELNRKNGRNTDGTFASGNAGGKKGSRHAITVLAEKLLSEDVEGVVQSVVKAAKNGDTQAARVILDRIAPPRKDSTISIELPEIKSLDDVAQAMSMVVKATANAEIGLSEADMLTKLLQGYSAALEASEISKRLTVLEAKLNSD
jgi:hypothetical protein